MEATKHRQIRFDCDVSKLQGCSLTGLALVGRNHRGQVFVGKAWNTNVSTVLKVEAMACRDAMKTAVNKASSNGDRSVVCR